MDEMSWTQCRGQSVADKVSGRSVVDEMSWTQCCGRSAGACYENPGYVYKNALNEKISYVFTSKSNLVAHKLSLYIRDYKSMS